MKKKLTTKKIVPITTDGQSLKKTTTRKSVANTISVKSQVIEELFRICKTKRNYRFHNDLVKEVSARLGFGNPFDVTKLDNKSKLPPLLIKNDYAIVHLGNGEHMFVKKINNFYHDFEPIKMAIQWEYRKSILNQFDTSESNILSVANNQRILHHFLFGKDTELEDVDIIKRPKTYFPHRTKTSFEYTIGKEHKIKLENIQIEIDLTIEYQGVVGVFEAKNGKPDNFSVYQLYHPFLYFYNANKDKTVKGQIKRIYCVYLVREKHIDGDILKLWAYTFTCPTDITSIKLVKSAAYKLITR